MGTQVSMHWADWRKLLDFSANATGEMRNEREIDRVHRELFEACAGGWGSQPTVLWEKDVPEALRAWLLATKKPELTTLLDDRLLRNFFGRFLEADIKVMVQIGIPEGLARSLRGQLLLSVYAPLETQELLHHMSDLSDADLATFDRIGGRDEWELSPEDCSGMLRSTRSILKSRQANQEGILWLLS